MKHVHRVTPYSLRIADQLKEKARSAAQVSRRSLNAELEVLIEDGFRWRDMEQHKQAQAIA